MDPLHADAKKISTWWQITCLSQLIDRNKKKKTCQAICILSPTLRRILEANPEGHLIGFSREDRRKVGRCRTSVKIVPTKSGQYDPESFAQALHYARIWYRGQKKVFPHFRCWNQGSQILQCSWKNVWEVEWRPKTQWEINWKAAGEKGADG